MRIIFAGTPEAAVPSLRALHEAGYEILAVVTRPDAPLGRKRVLTPSPVAQLAQELDLPLVKSARLDGPVAHQLMALRADLGAVVAYGGLVRDPLLRAPRHGWINVHFSLLPAWRGAAPVQRAIMAGEKKTGVSVFQLAEGLDTGPVHRMRDVSIGEQETAGELLERLASEAGPAELLAAIEGIAEGLQPQPQRGTPSHAAKLTAAESAVDWRMPASRVRDHIRGVTPEPGAAADLDGQRIKLLRTLPGRPGDPVPPPGTLRVHEGRLLVGTANGPLELERVQPSGRKPMHGMDWARGRSELDGRSFA